MGRAYVQVSPEVLIDLFKRPLYQQRPDGRVVQLKCNLPPDSRAVRAWPAQATAIGQDGDICCSFDSDEIVNKHGQQMERFDVTVVVDEGYSVVKDEGGIEP